MKKIVLFFVLILFTGVCLAQSQVVATLVHEGNVSTYYGFNAFADAYTAAVDGDIITLSSGAFKATNISKGLTVRGAGFVDDTKAQINSTIITGNISISVPDSLRLSFEGVMFNDEISLKRLYNSQFLKCYFGRLYNSYNTGTDNATNNTFYHCYIIRLGNIAGDNSFISCVSLFKGSEFCHYNFDNCILIPFDGSSISVSTDHSTYRNCIFIGKQSDDRNFSILNPSNSGIAYNCIYLDDTDIFSKQINYTNQTVSVPISSVFKTYDGQGIPLEEMFELTDSAATVFLGSDGTQVGIYGGMFPFSPTPSYPRITKFEVSNKTDAEGKLRMKLEVKSGE